MIVAVVGLEREGRVVAGNSVRVVACGGSGEVLRRKLPAGLDDSVSGIISFGICGGLSPDLKPGVCIIASEIVSDGAKFPADVDWSARLQRLLPHAANGSIAGFDRLLATAREKSALFAATGALAADMESHTAADIAAQHGIPFACLRAVADPAWSDLPPAASCAVVNENGMVNKGAVLRSLLAQPAQIPALMRVARESNAAFKALFRCRDLIGSGLAGPDLREPALDMV